MNTLDFKKKKQLGQKISMVTCYDSWSAKIIADTPIDAVLVGDSAAMVIHGYDSTVHATMDMMEVHTRAVSRNCPGKYVVGDMPFLTFRKDLNTAMNAAERFMRAGAQAIKLEGVHGHESIIKHIVESGIPVMGHIGLTPQSVNTLGGFKVQGTSSETAEDLLAQAKLLESLGCFSLVLECVPSSLGALITESLQIPTIGIGAGVGCDGQVLVLQDLLGMQKGFRPKFLRTYLDGYELVQQALNQFDQDVKGKAFPLEKESYL